MTSTPVMGADMSMNMLSTPTPNVSKQGGMDFKDFMKKPDTDVKTADVKPGNDLKDRTASAEKEKPETPQKVSDIKETKSISKDGTEVSDKDVDDVVKAVDTVEEKMEEDLDVTVEEIEEALEVLGLTQIAVLNTDVLPEIVAEVKGEDSVLSFATDQELYEDLTEITEFTDEVLTQVSEEMGIDKEELTDAIKDFSTALKEVPNEADVTNEADVPEDTEVEPKKVSFEDKIQITSSKETKVDSNVSAELNEVKEAEKTVVKTPGSERKESSAGQERHDAPLSFAQNLIEKVTEKLNETEATISYSDIDVRNIMDQITESIKVDLSDEMNEVNLRLHPESLGSVSVKIQANREGVMTAQFTAHNESVKAIIESQAVVLRETLEQKGVTVEAIEVTVQSHGFERNLSDNGKGEAGSYKEQKKGVRRINLSEISEDVTEDPGDEIIKDMMAQNGNTIDYSA